MGTNYSDSVLNAQIDARVNLLDVGSTFPSSGMHFYVDDTKAQDLGRLALNTSSFSSGGAQGVANVDTASGASVTNNGGKVRITSAGNFTNTLIGMYVACTFAATYNNNIIKITARTDNTIDLDLDYSSDTTVNVAVGYQPAWPGASWLNVSVTPELTPSIDATPSYVEFEDRDGNILWVGTVGLIGSGANVEFNSTTWETTVPVQLINALEQQLQQY